MATLIINTFQASERIPEPFIHISLVSRDMTTGTWIGKNEESRIADLKNVLNKALADIKAWEGGL